MILLCCKTYGPMAIILADYFVMSLFCRSFAVLKSHDCLSIPLGIG